MNEVREYLILKNRIYYAAKDGMAMSLYTLLSDCVNKYNADDLLNEVSVGVW